MELQSLVVAFKIIERRNGAVYKTEEIGELWVNIDLRMDPNNHDIIYVPLSTSRSKELYEKRINTKRRKPK